MRLSFRFTTTNDWTSCRAPKSTLVSDSDGDGDINKAEANCISSLQISFNTSLRVRQVFS